MDLKPPVKLKPPKKRKFYPILNGVFYGLIFAGLFSAIVFVFAVPPDNKYDFAATLDPNCIPGSTNCSVVSPAVYSFAANNFSGTGTFTTTGAISGGAITGTSIIDSGLTASKPVFTDANKQLTSTGTLGLDQGGTAASLTASSGGIVYSGASALAILAATATANQVLLSGSSAAPAWSTATYPATATSTGTILRADGTNWTATTATYPTTTTINQILYSSAANVIGGITTGNSGVLVTSGAGVPSISSTLPASIILSNTTNIGAATGVGISATNGVLTLAGLKSAGNNENLTFDFETTANTVAVATGTGVTTINFGSLGLTTTGAISAGAITGTSFIIGANTISSFANLDSLADLSFVSTSFVKMTAANTFALDTSTYQASDAILTALAGLTTAQGDLIYATGSDALAVLNKNATATRYLANTGTSNNPAWAQVDLSNGVTGVLPLANGGTAKALTAANGGIIYSDADSMEVLAATATANQVLLSGSSAAPAWSTATYPATATSTGTILRADGTNWVATTATYPTTTTINQILYSTSANVIGGNAGLTFDGNTLNITSTSAAQEKLSYNSSIYTTLTTGSDGTLTVANIGGATGDIVLTPTGTGDVALLSDTGKMILGGNANTNNEALKLDFETTANTVAVTSTTGVSNITWTGNLTLGGNTTVGTLVTRVVTSAPTDADVNGSLVVDSGDGGRIYFRYGGNWHYVAQTAGFQIPDSETIDPISGEQIKEGDVVLGMINKTLEDKALHGIWVKWDSVKAQLLAEARGELSKTGTWGTGAISDVKTETLLDKVTNVLFSLGISAKDGVTSITQLAVERFSAKNARVETLEMIDKTTGEIYCTWLENGELMKAKGECGSIEVASANPQPVGQSVEQAQEIIQQAQQAASNALETSQAAQQAVEENAQQAVLEAAENIVEQQVQEQIQEQVQQEVQQQLQEQQQTPTTETSGVSSSTPEVTTPTETPAPEEQPAPEVQPEQPAQPEQPSAGEIIQDTAAGLLQSMWEFASWLFGMSFDQVSKLIPDAIKNSTASILTADFQIISDGIKSAAKWIKIVK